MKTGFDWLNDTGCGFLDKMNDRATESAEQDQTTLSAKKTKKKLLYELQD